MLISRREFLKTAGGGLGFLLMGSPVLAQKMDNLKPVTDPFKYPNREWENFFDEMWDWDKVARSTHGCNCTGSCTWLVYVKDGVILREEQAADYDSVTDKLPDYNPRGCQKGACYAAEYVYGDRRVKYPLIRQGERGEGKWKKATWDEALTYIAEKVIKTVKEDGPDHISFFTVIPAMSSISFTGGARYAHGLGGVLHSFYDWYGDLPPGSPITLAEQTDVAESVDWVNAKMIVMWGSNVVETRIPDAHYVWEAKYRGSKVVAIFPEYNPSAVHADLYLPVKAGSDMALALAASYVIIKEKLYREEYLLEQTDMPFLVRSDTKRFLRESDMKAGGKEDQFYLWDKRTNYLVKAPGCQGSDHREIRLGNIQPCLDGEYTVRLADGKEIEVKTVFEFLKGKLKDKSPEWAEPITGIKKEIIYEFARDFASHYPATIIHGTGVNHWYHNDLINRSFLLLLSLTGNIGINGGGFNHYVGQEKLWPVKGWAKLMFSEGFPDKMKGSGPQRFQNTTLWTYVHSNMEDLMDKKVREKHKIKRPIRDYIWESVSKWEAGDKTWQRLYPMGSMGNNREEFVKTGKTSKSPKILFVWRANYFNQAKGHEYVLKNLFPKLDLIVDINFHMDTTALYSDVVLPAASWYEKWDLNTTDLHSFIHPFSPALPPQFESKTDWQIFLALAKKTAEIAKKEGLNAYLDSEFGITRDYTKLYEYFKGQGGIFEDDKNAVQFILDNSPETRGFTVSELAEKPRRMKETNDTTWTSTIQPGRPYTPFLKNTEGKEAYLTITGRQQYYIDHDWFLEMEEELPTYKPQIDADKYPLHYNTPHPRWSIHSTWRNAKHMLRLQRGGPVAYLNLKEAKKRNLKDNDWIKVYNAHGEFIARVYISNRLPDGMLQMYHAWERYVGFKKGNWQSVSPIRIKPTQMAGGYGQLHFKLNYWGPTGNNRDILVEVEKAPV